LECGHLLLHATWSPEDDGLGKKRNLIRWESSDDRVLSIPENLQRLRKQYPEIKMLTQEPEAKIFWKV
jgi:hypothetical protein